MPNEWNVIVFPIFDESRSPVRKVKRKGFGWSATSDDGGYFFEGSPRKSVEDALADAGKTIHEAGGRIAKHIVRS